MLVAEVTSISGDVVRGLHDRFGSLAIETAKLHGVVLRPPTDLAARDELVYRIANESVESDRLILANGDRTEGGLQELTSEAAALSIGSSVARLPRDRVTAVGFAAPPAGGAPPEDRAVLVGFRDGSLVRAAQLAIAADQVRVESAGGVAVASASPDDVVFVQPLGGSATYLSDLVADSYSFSPYLDIEWPYHRDRNVAGGRLRAGGALFAKGLGMHSGGRIAYRLGGEPQWFAAQVAVDDQTEGQGSVVFHVYLAKDGQWRRAWSSPTIRGGAAPIPVRVDLAGAEGIALAVDYADRGDQWDRADWLDARLVRSVE
jgi:hypothetical protein